MPTQSPLIPKKTLIRVMAYVCRGMGASWEYLSALPLHRLTLMLRCAEEAARDEAEARQELIETMRTGQSSRVRNL